MRLSYILLVTATAILATLDAASATGGAAPPGPNAANALDVTHAQESTGRFLRARKENDDLDSEDDVSNDATDDRDDDDEEEERMFSLSTIKSNAKAALTAAKLSAAKSTDDMAAIVAKLDDKREINSLFSKAEGTLKKQVPGFEAGMSLNDFEMALRGARVPQGEKDVLIVAYSKYLALNNLI
ncbi:unnamed protein product [Phytophthora lilii]|uniref:RxLR effector protein n=1 Tax=Phytophthora lilii TaxID=2077276 RepID=A0A9W6U245_9STRA|nr:unnamed protein product [Phytophthora lilii]